MGYALYDCNFGITLNGIVYHFTHVDSVQIDDPERTRLTRGANGGNNVGLAFKEGLKEGKTVSVALPDVPMDLHNVLKAAYKAQSRMDLNIVSRSDGSTKIGINCILGQMPQQLNMDDSPESLNTILIFETFEIEEVKKS